MARHDSGNHGAAVAAFAGELRRHVMRRLIDAPGVSSFDADDIAQEIVVRFLADADAVMAAYTPVAYAAASVADRTEDWRRSQRTQRCEGARTRVDADGSVVVKREVVALEEARSSGAGERPGSSRSAEALVTTDVERVGDRLALSGARAGLDPEDRWLLVRIGAEGHTVTEVARMTRRPREHVSRRYNAARRRAAELLMAGAGA
jgi:DNA-directed RNA polymerase specialized sigma24 family protein